MAKGIKPTAPTPKAAPKVNQPKAVRAKAPAKAALSTAVTRGQMQGAATSGPKKLEQSNVLFSNSLAKKAQNWTQKTWGATRRKVHKALTKDPAFLKTKHATPENLKRMNAGKAPLAPKNEQLGKRKVMELDHKWERQDGANPTRVDNLRLVSPLKHKMKIMRKFHQAAETPMPKELKTAPSKPVKRGIKSI